MTPEEYDQLMGNSQLQQQVGMTNMQAQQQLMFQEQEKGLAEEQLDVNETIFNLYNLLCGKRIKFDDSGQRSWDSTIDFNLRILSDNGIQKLMQIIVAYVNKLKLLSNHDNEEILRAMFDFTTELNDLVLLKYEDLFYKPTFEECKTILKERIKEKIDIRSFAVELVGLKPHKENIEQELLDELEGRIEDEMQKIRGEEQKRRIKEYGILTLIIEHEVLDTYRRAEGGKERETLRRHANFSEIRALQPENMQKKGGVLSWLKG